MSELGELRDKIHKVDKGVVEIKTILETSLPDLATDDSVKLAIAEHSAGCERVSAKGSLKRDAAMVTAAGGLVVSISQAIRYLFF